MGVYLRNITKEQFIEDCNAMGVLVITEGVSEIDLVRCGECKYQYMCGHQINRHGLTLKLTYCEHGERRADGDI